MPNGRYFLMSENENEDFEDLFESMVKFYISRDKYFRTIVLEMMSVSDDPKLQDKYEKCGDILYDCDDIKFYDEIILCFDDIYKMVNFLSIEVLQYEYELNMNENGKKIDLKYVNKEYMSEISGKV